MFGTDYNKNMFKIGPEKSFKLLTQYRSIDKIKESGVDVSILKHERVRELFRKYQKFDEYIPYCKPADYNKLSQFLFTHGIRYNIEKLRRDLAPPVLLFEE
jgi:5'-3' exonuclease